MVPAAQAAANALAVSDLLKAFDAQGMSLPEGIQSRIANLAGLNPNQVVTAILKLPGDPVAVVKSQTPDQQLTAAEKDAIKGALKAQQDALIPTIEALGGRVVAQYQVAYNGIAVQIPRSKLAGLAQLHAVIGISPARSFTPDHTTSLPFLGVPAVWNGVNGFRGDGEKIAIIDTGIDYTHANFGGPGTVAAFETAFANSAAPPDPSMFGPNAPKVKGGTDLVGDAFNGTGIPAPDPNPLDCFGHGSHVAGTAAGFGVTGAGATYHGPYDATTFTRSFNVGPGVAPLADLYSVRVFGCVGFTPSSIVVAAIDWAVDHDMDVVSMSLGSDFGTATDPDVEASNNAALAGVVVVAAAGNAGPSPYIVSAPSIASRAISVAADDSTPSFPGANVALGTGKTLLALNANGQLPLPSGSLKVAVLKNAAGGIALGCNPADYTGFPGGVAGKLVITARGVCARVSKAIFGQMAGAAAVGMVNTAGGYPPFEGPITSNPDTGIPFTVTIPFLGFLQADGASLIAADGSTASLTATPLANPGFKAFASFSSSGPTDLTSALKPDIVAPGVSIKSTAMGTGNGGVRESGTSMATPHVAGIAALVREAHPSWKVSDVKAAILNTGSAADVNGFVERRGGTGVVQPGPATKTDVIASFDPAAVSLNLGFAELGRDFNQQATLRISNKGDSAAMFTLSFDTTPGSAAHTVTFDPATVTVNPGESIRVTVTVNVPAATVGNSLPTSANRQAFRNVAGLVTLTPTGGSKSGVVLHVAYYLVPRALSKVGAEVDGELSPGHTASVELSNARGVIGGVADLYAWGLSSPHQLTTSNDLRAVGVQAVKLSPTRSLLIFAVNTWNRWSSPSDNEFDILLDTNGDGVPDVAVVGFDLGAILTGRFDGRYGSFVIDLTTIVPTIVAARFAVAPTDSSTLLLPAATDELGLSLANPRFAYVAAGFSGIDGSVDIAPGLGFFNAFAPAITSGVAFSVPVGASGTVAVSIDRTEFASTPSLGLMIVVLDNSAGRGEALLLHVDGEGEGEG
jgi:subtilisin family serine protease